MALIQGVTVKPLRVIPDERGYLFEMLRSDDPLFQKFGQTYVTAIYPGAIKAWHYHKKQTDHFVCVHGMAKVVLYDDRAGHAGGEPGQRLSLEQPVDARELTVLTVSHA